MTTPDSDADKAAQEFVDKVCEILAVVLDPLINRLLQLERHVSAIEQGRAAATEAKP